MITIRKSTDRGHAEHGWLDTWHTFSFASYLDRNHMGFRTLRVINDDVVAPARGFGMHPHENMEILTYVLDGALEHKDSMGNTEVIRAGELQRMSAGSGIYHSEYNASDKDPVHLLQIWIKPEQINIEPSYEQISVADRLTSPGLHLVAAPGGGAGILDINQDAKLHIGRVESGNAIEHNFAAGRHGWLHVVKGEIDVNGAVLGTADSAAISETERLQIRASSDAEFLLFDLA